MIHHIIGIIIVYILRRIADETANKIVEKVVNSAVNGLTNIASNTSTAIMQKTLKIIENDNVDDCEDLSKNLEKSDLNK